MMAFRNVQFEHLVRFNSAVASEFLEEYDKFMDNKLIERSRELPHRTFAPSSFRCHRKQWFRLRGVDPDELKVADRVLDFSAEIGTACHRMLQNNFKELFKERWIDVAEFLKEQGSTAECVYSEDSGETLVEINQPPIRFAVDGLFDIEGTTYLVEIKSSEYSSWNDLTDPKSEHISQVQVYCSLLNINKVLFIYIDRQYGGMKCFEHEVTLSDRMSVKEDMDHIMRCVAEFIAPNPLPSGDAWCTPSRCQYYKKCSEYGRM